MGPFLGPQPFDREHQSLFFGRRAELEQLHTMVLANPVVVLYAGSGAGKTSLLKAGLIPLLEEQDDFQVLPVARVTAALPRAPGKAKANQFVEAVLSSWRAEDEHRRTDDATTIAEHLNRTDHPDTDHGWAAPRLVVIDQLEEIFTLLPHHWEERNEFFGQLGATVRSDPLLRVILAIREDYLYELEPQRVRLPGRLKARFRLELLREPAALDAVVLPVEAAGRSFAPGVAERLVRNLRASSAAPTAEDDEELLAEFVEPVQLQVTCASLWQALPPERMVITDDDVRTAGDVDEALRALLAEAIEVAARGAGWPEHRLRTEFAAAFITSMNTRGTAYLSEDGVANIPWAAIQALERRHIIRAEWRSGAHWYELTHDRFIGPIRESNSRFLLGEVTGLRGGGRAVPVLLERRSAPGPFTIRRRGKARAVAAERPKSIESESGDKIHGAALCLAGGGYRSMLFTAGVLWRLNDAGWLQRLDEVVSNTGAAVAAAALGLGWEALEFDDRGRGRRFVDLVIAPLHKLANQSFETTALWVATLVGRNGNEELANDLARRLFGARPLSDLPDRPRFVFTASHLASGELWRIGKDRMGNARAGWVHAPELSVAAAVAASGASPPLLSPAVLDSLDRRAAVVTSGALYDTLALETVWRHCDTVLVSDGKASRPLAHADRKRLSHLIDFVAASDSELHRLRRQQALLAYTSRMKSGSYWSINSDVQSFPLDDPLECDPERVAPLATVPARLTRLDRPLQERLVNWGYAICDAALRSHVDRTVEPPPGFPYPEQPLG